MTYSLQRPLGPYALTVGALYGQTKMNYHLSEMKDYASKSTVLTATAGSELTNSIELESKSALDSESGMELQSESIASEAYAESEFAKAEGEKMLADEFSEEAKFLREQSAAEVLESQAALHKAEELEMRSQELRIQSEEDQSASVFDEDKAVAFINQATSAEKVAEGAEGKSGEYEAVAVKKGSESAKDSEALVESETEALEEAEGVAACTAIPFINVVCDAFGAITEAGIQTIAAYEGAKAAVESVSAAVAEGKGRAQIALALEKHDEAASAVSKAEKYHSLASAEQQKADAEVVESNAAKADAEVLHTKVGELEEESEKDEAMAKIDDSKAIEYHAKAAEDESAAVEKESFAIATQSESDELLSQSAEEEFESESERVDAESTEAQAERFLNRSILHGVQALGMAVQSLITACAVLYIIVFKGVSNTLSFCKGQTAINLRSAFELLCGLVLHLCVIWCVVLTFSDKIFNVSYEKTSILDHWVAIIHLAIMSASIETMLHCASTMLCAIKRGENIKATSTATLVTFITHIIYLTPIFLLECLIITTLFGPAVFNVPGTSWSNWLPWSWCIFLSSALIHFCFFKLAQPSQTRHATNICESCNDWVESYFCRGQEAHEKCRPLNVRIADCKYGSIEEMPVLVYNGKEDADSDLSSLSSKNMATAICKDYNEGCVESTKRLCHAQYVRLRITLDLLVLSLMAMLMWRLVPVAKILQPVGSLFFGTNPTWLSALVPLTLFFALILAVHHIFVR